MHSDFYTLVYPDLSAQSDLGWVFLIFKKFAHRIFIPHYTAIAVIHSSASSLNSTMTTLLYAIIFNFYTLAWEPFPQIEPQYMDSHTQCVQRMNEINRRLESTHSAVRAVCSPIQ